VNDIFLIPIGTLESRILNSIGDALKKVFKCRVTIGKTVPIPPNTFDRKRRQYYSTSILKLIESYKPREYRRILGVIDEDLYVPQLNFVFGEANIISGSAIISLTRLRQEFYGLTPDRELFLLRAIKEAIHEIGHTYGLGHCPNRRCIMHFSNSLRDTDIKGPDFCSRCKQRIR
jgi:archaemetzincin